MNSPYPSPCCIPYYQGFGSRIRHRICKFESITDLNVCVLLVALVPRPDFLRTTHSVEYESWPANHVLHHENGKQVQATGAYTNPEGTLHVQEFIPPTNLTQSNTYTNLTYAPYTSGCRLADDPSSMTAPKSGTSRDDPVSLHSTPPIGIWSRRCPLSITISY